MDRNFLQEIFHGTSEEKKGASFLIYVLLYLNLKNYTLFL